MPFQIRSVGALARGLIGLAAIVLIFYFLSRSLASNWSDLKSEEIDVQPALLLLSVVPGIASILVLSLAWTSLVTHLAGRDPPSRGQLPKVFLYSWIGRYVPGKVAYVLGRFYLGRSIGFSSPVLIGSIAYENVLLLVAAAAFASVTVVPSLAVVSESVLPYLALPALALGGVVALHPRVLGWALRFAMRLFGREEARREWLLPPRQMAKVIVLYIVAFSLSGVGLYLLIISVTAYSPRYLPLVAGAYTLAGVIGMISIFAPAGIGVREGILVGVLQTTMPVELAILLALVARVWATVIDLLVVTGCFAYDYASGDRILFTSLRGARGAEGGGDPSSALDP